MEREVAGAAGEEGAIDRVRGGGGGRRRGRGRGRGGGGGAARGLAAGLHGEVLLVIDTIDIALLIS